MKLILYPKDFERIPQISCYNNNYYKHKESGVTILEECDELYQVNTYTDVTDPKNTYFLGCVGCHDGSSLDGEKEIEVDFKIQYT